MNDAFVKTGDHTEVANNSKSRWLIRNFFAILSMPLLISLMSLGHSPNRSFIAISTQNSEYAVVGEESVENWSAILNYTPWEGIHLIRSHFTDQIKPQGQTNFKEWEMPGGGGGIMRKRYHR